MAAPSPRRPIVGSVAGFVSSTNIDRRTCQRVVPMKVLCLGLSRTGTASLRQALLDLHYEDVYHFASVLQENPRDAEMWIDAIRAKFHGEGKTFGRKEWDQLLGHCMAVTDSPCVFFDKELLEAYPDAKVILTVRDSPQQWVDSQMNTIVQYALSVVNPPAPKGLSIVYNWFQPATRPVDRLMQTMVAEAEIYKTLLADAQKGTTQDSEAFYQAHIEKIRQLVPADNLLIMNVKEGWDPLCKFLGHEQPAWPFPRVNSTEEFMQNAIEVGAMMKHVTNARILKALVAVTAVSVVGIAWWVRSTRGIGTQLW